MGIYDELLEWSAEKLPLWRQDALRRLCIDDVWSPEDINELLDLAMQHQGIPSAGSPAIVATPFSDEHFPAEATPEQEVALTSLHSLVNVGRIPSDQTLTFEDQGLTIVYGGNGTGKSGYARVLKQACRARSPGTVYPNAFSQDFSSLVSSAKIGFTLDGSPDESRWTGARDHSSRPELRGISVFDGDCARHYLQTKEAASFQPIALSYLQRLASQLSSTLSPILTQKIEALGVDVTPFNVISSETEAGRAIHPISAATDLTTARTLSTLCAEELLELARLPKEISESDPTAKAIVLENAATRVDEVAKQFTDALELVSNDVTGSVADAFAHLREAETAERIAAELLQNEDETTLLPGTGQSAWGILFKAAQNFSVNAAYVGKPFPALDDDAQCVFCQQELTADAKKRLQRFDMFVKDTASEIAQRARLALETKIRAVAGTNVVVTVPPNMIDSLARRQPTIIDSLKALQDDLNNRLNWLRLSIQSGNWEAKPEYRDAETITKLQNIASSLRDDANALRDTLNPDLLAAKKSRLKELEARKLLSDHIESISRAVDNLVLRTKLQLCLSDVTNTRSITLFAGKLATKHLSEAFAESMNDELRRLDVHHIKVAVGSSGDVGSVRLGVVLSESSLDAHLVLSEAEQRMCALAFFFAELHHSASTSGIVLDDPVSSLDHNHRTSVARRIVEDSQSRQVIVFTHDAIFFNELTTLCGDGGVEPSVKSITYRAEGPGFIDAGLPYDLRKHKERIAQHLIDHRKIAASFNNPPGDAERIAMRHAYDDLRVTIEVGIEDTVLNETVVRFRDNISVGRLDGVMAVEEEDFREVQRLHDRCCRHVSAHSHARGQQRPVAQPLELLQDIQAVNELFKGIRTRRG